MTFDTTWEYIHQTQDWGKYPNEQLVRWVMRNFGGIPTPLRRQVKILDLGCGQGAATLFLAREGFRVTAVDGSRTAIDKLGHRLAKEMLSATTLVCEAHSVPFDDAHFHAVIDIVCLAHNDDTQRISAEVARVLKLDGKLFSVIPKTSCSRSPYDGKGAVKFMNSREVHGVYREYFDVRVGWEDVQGFDDKLFLSHWLIDGKRNDRSRTDVRSENADVVSG